MASKNFNEFTLKINGDNSIEAKLVTHGDPEKEETVSDECGPQSDKDEEYLKEAIEKLKAGLLDGCPDEIRRLGQELYLALFPKKVDELFRKAIKKIREMIDQENKLRVIVDVDRKSKVYGCGWPLEFLFCKAEGLWLATEPNLMTLSRRTYFTDIELKPVIPPLRALVVISNPSKPENLQGVMAGKILEEMRKWVGSDSETQNGKERQTKMEVKVLGQLPDVERKQVDESGLEYLDKPATWENLSSLMQGDWKPHVLHFIGHGKLEVYKGFLALVKDGGEADWCSADDIQTLFAGWPPRLVLLQACESAVSGTEASFMGVANQLVEQNIPAVVAMQFSITNENATLFARGFYEALQGGKDLDEAVQFGRNKICLKKRWSEHHFGTPVLFIYNPAWNIQTPSSIRSSKLPPSTTLQQLSVDVLEGCIKDALKWLEIGDIEEAIIHVNAAQEILKNKNPLEAERLGDALKYLNMPMVGPAIEILKLTSQKLKGQVRPTITKDRHVAESKEEKMEQPPSPQLGVRDQSKRPYESVTGDSKPEPENIPPCQTPMPSSGKPNLNA